MEQATAENERQTPIVPSSAVTAHISSHTASGNVILSTAVVFAFDNQGTPKPCQVLLDCDSQANFISRVFFDTLGLTPRLSNLSISGVNGTTSTKVGRVRLQSRISPYTAFIDCIVADRVTDRIPAISMKRTSFDIPRNISLADPQFHVSSDIDLLIGAELFWDILSVRQIKPPILQKMRLGWILAGRLGTLTRPLSRMQSYHSSITNSQLHDQLTRFWELEDNLNPMNEHMAEESACEQHFLNNIGRTLEGRYVVKLPVKEHFINGLGKSRAIALKRFNGLEGCFNRDPELRTRYTHFMNEYLSLGHMRPDEHSTSFYLPHHCVFKTADLVTKLRVVFDASCKTDAGVSLNDALMVGSLVQQDLISILMRFRTFRYVITADIVKMYRQILIDPSQTPLQRILWRSNSKAEINTYELVTLTYDTSPASYLATRCLLHLADQYAARFPLGSVCLKRDFYVDDMLTGADTIEEAHLIRDEITQLLRLRAFELSKWASNQPEILGSVGVLNDELVHIKDERNSPILGIQWSQSHDTFQFACKLDSANDASNKRIILSEISGLFDPLGL